MRHSACATRTPFVPHTQKVAFLGKCRTRVVFLLRVFTAQRYFLLRWPVCQSRKRTMTFALHHCRKRSSCAKRHRSYTNSALRRKTCQRGQVASHSPHQSLHVTTNGTHAEEEKEETEEAVRCGAVWYGVVRCGVRPAGIGENCQTHKAKMTSRLEQA